MIRRYFMEGYDWGIRLGVGSVDVEISCLINQEQQDITI